jgi:hypothetical protein
MIIVVVGKHRKPHAPPPQTARTATANRTHRDRKPHEPQRNRSVNLFLGSTVRPASYLDENSNAGNTEK